MNRMLILVVGLALGAAAAVEAQQTAADVDALIGEAEGLLAGRKPAEAKAAFDRALTAARKLSLARQEGASLCGVGDAMRALAQYQPAYDSALQCLEIYTRLGFQTARDARA